jgi:hypothetical protein
MPPIMRWPPVTRWPSSRRGPTGPVTRQKSSPACCSANAGSTLVCATGASIPWPRPMPPSPSSSRSSTSGRSRSSTAHGARSTKSSIARPWARCPYEFAAWPLGVKVNIDYHIESDGHYYSVPYQLVGPRVDVRAAALSIEVFCVGRRVASHLPSWRPAAHRRHAEWTLSRIVSWARRTGPATAALAEAIMASRPQPELGYRSCLGSSACPIATASSAWMRPRPGRCRPGPS